MQRKKQAESKSIDDLENKEMDLLKAAKSKKKIHHQGFKRKIKTHQLLISRLMAKHFLNGIRQNTSKLLH